jgi:hypothetical protein
VLNILIGGTKLKDEKLIKNILEALEDMFQLDKINGWVGSHKSVTYAFNNMGGID